MTLAIKAHAKFNPYLWVGPLRNDGYHEIETLLQAVELHDVLTFSPSKSTAVRCSYSRLDGEANLVYKAYRLASEIIDLPALDIYIEKNIPTQAGLGGGSSDAAAALKVFDRLSGGALGAHVREIGLACGSDVPFFLGEGARARASGRGEQVELLDTVPVTGVVIVKPLAVACDTTQAYARLDAIQNRPVERPETMPYNDFERVAPRESTVLIDKIRSMGIVNCGLCGSGSAVYGVSDQAQDIAEVVRSESVWVSATKTIASFGEPWTL